MNTYYKVLITLFISVFVWSAINPKDYFTWFLEVLPAVIAFALIFITFKKFPLTPLAYTLITFHSIILIVGGHYTYAEVPLFDWLKETFDHSRNNYDKVGHFAQGFIPAIITREILIRKEVINKKGWMPFIVVCICLAISATYEFIEWWVSIGTSSFTNESAEAFLGMQGYVWDTQSDMFYATIGAVSALILLSSMHDKQLELVQ